MLAITQNAPNWEILETHYVFKNNLAVTPNFKKACIEIDTNYM